MRDRLEEICAEVSQAIDGGARFVVLSDRDSERDLAPIPSLLLTAAVHHHLIREQTAPRSACSSRPATSARSPRRAAHRLRRGRGQPVPRHGDRRGPRPRGDLEGVTPEKAVNNLIKALGKGVLKIMSKMGISTVASYRGAQVFEAIGLSQELVDRYFTGTESQLGGVGLDVIAEEVAAGTRWPTRRTGCPPAAPRPRGRRRVPVAPRGRAAPVQPGDRLPAAARDARAPLRHLQAVHRRVDDQTVAPDDPARAAQVQARRRHRRLPVPIDEVEPVSEIVKRFTTGAMSYGSISQEAHETLADRDEPARRQVQHR